MRIVIAGAGSVGTFIAEDLAKAGHEVVIVEVDADRVAEGCAAASPSASPGWPPTPARSASSPGPASTRPTWWPPSPATTRTTS